MTELEYLRGRVRLLETLLTKTLPVLRLAAYYPTLVGRIEAALNKSSLRDEPLEERSE